MRRNVSFTRILLTCAVLAAGLHTGAQAQKPSLKGADLLCNGESFFAASNICSELSRLAKADGVLASSENFKQVAVSGVPIATVFNQFKNANPKPKFVVTDGGGIDLMNNNCTAGDVNCSMIQNLKKTMTDYIAEMAKSGVVSFIWMCYPDPQGANWAKLKTGQDIWAVAAKQVMDATTKPRPYWVDLRPVWAGHYSQYTSDGIHATNAGGTATAQAFWDAMKANDYAFFKSTSVQGTNDLSRTTAKQSAIGSLTARNGSLAMSLSVDKSSEVSVRLMTVSGRCVFTASRNVAAGKAQSVEFALNGLARGVYCSEIVTGTSVSRQPVMVQ